jgi:ElaB/YqjD/DUF883 family membrane-anchored ribosome-binding protein
MDRRECLRTFVAARVCHASLAASESIRLGADIVPDRAVFAGRQVVAWQPESCPSARSYLDINVLHVFLLEQAQTIDPRPWRNIVTTLRTATEAAAELGKEARESIEELGRSAGRRLDEARDETGGALHSAASSVRKAGRQGSAAIDNCSTRTADRLDATASYIEDHDLGDALGGLRKLARRHPTGTLVAAATIGFLAGSAFGRVTHVCAKAHRA